MIVNFLWDYTIYKPVDLFLLKQTNKSKSVQEQIGGQTTGLTFPHDETNQTDYCTLGCSTGKKIKFNAIFLPKLDRSSVFNHAFGLS